MQEPFKVCIRIKPIEGKQKFKTIKNGSETICQMDIQSQSLNQQEIVEQRAFTFDHVFNSSEATPEIYQICIQDMINDCVSQGYNGTILAYGQTGSGKSYTMFGNLYDPSVQDEGLVALVLQQLFQINAKISISYLEIYNEQIRDLIGDNINLNLVEDQGKALVQDALEVEILNLEQAKQVIWSGNQKRVMAATNANNVSSRSHAVIQVYIVNGQFHSKLSLVDLAGSEKANVNDGKGIRQQEGSNINRSLLALGNCINSLAENNINKKSHIPYRDSKLTRMLKDSLGGNTKTLMIACLQQSFICQEESINTLKYATRARAIKKKITQNIKPITEVQNNDAFILLQNENNTLKQELLNIKILQDREVELKWNLLQIDNLQQQNKQGLHEQFQLKDNDKYDQSEVNRMIQGFKQAIQQNEKIKQQLIEQFKQQNSNQDSKDLIINKLKQEIYTLKAQVQEKDQIIQQIKFPNMDQRFLISRPHTSYQETDRAKPNKEFSLDLEARKESLQYCGSSASIKNNSSREDEHQQLVQLNKARESFKIFRGKLYEINSKIINCTSSGQQISLELVLIFNKLQEEIEKQRYKVSPQDQQLIIQIQQMIYSQKQTPKVQTPTQSQQSRSRSMNIGQQRGKVASQHVRKPLQQSNHSPVNKPFGNKLSQLVQKTKKITEKPKYIERRQNQLATRVPENMAPTFQTKPKRRPKQTIRVYLYQKSIPVNIIMIIPKHLFSFFQKEFSHKTITKCCRYNQNGKPMQPQHVHKLASELKEFLEGWHVSDLRLNRYFFSEDFMSAVKFINDVATLGNYMDFLFFLLDKNTTRNCPSFQYQKGELLTLELYSPPLDGLSQVDFELAMKINHMDFKKYYLIPLEGPDNYKKQVRAHRMREQAKQIQMELQ